MPDIGNHPLVRLSACCKSVKKYPHFVLQPVTDSKKPSRKRKGFEQFGFDQP
jgi:hypothetical protein